MYLVGGGTHPGSGLPVIYEGARITANLLCEDFGIRAPWVEGAGMVGPEFSAEVSELPRAAKVAAAY
jgi:phytoene desaturase